jgi:hypothetical protein
MVRVHRFMDEVYEGRGTITSHPRFFIPASL